jgi:HlyD family secretion protein
MNKKLKWTLIIAGGAVVLYGISKMMGGSDKTEKVSIEKATQRTIIESVNASGKVYPEVEVKISPDIAGQITELNVEEGDTVRKGEVLAKIYADIYALQREEAASRVNQSIASVDNSKATLESLRASLDLARQTLERNRTLYDQKVISKSELEQYEATFRTAEANYNAAQQSIKGLQANVQSTRTGLSKASKDLSRTTIVAPMDGVISSLKVKKGESVSGSTFNVGTEMMTVSDMASLEVRVDVGENDIVKINIGDSADVEVDAYNNRKFKGVVTKIASSTKSAGVSLTANDVTNYEVRIRIDTASYRDLIGKTFPFRPGMNASADIKTRRIDNVLSVPIAAVNARVRGSDQSMSDKKETDKKNKGDEEGMAEVVTDISDELEEVVFILQKDGTVKKVVVKSGIQDINYIQVVSGLSPGDEVVTGPYTAISKTLKDGMKVKVVPRDKLFEK